MNSSPHRTHVSRTPGDLKGSGHLEGLGESTMPTSRGKSFRRPSTFINTFKMIDEVVVFVQPSARVGTASPRLMVQSQNTWTSFYFRPRKRVELRGVIVGPHARVVNTWKVGQQSRRREDFSSIGLLLHKPAHALPSIDVFASANASSSR